MASTNTLAPRLARAARLATLVGCGACSGSQPSTTDPGDAPKADSSASTAPNASSDASPGDSATSEGTSAARRASEYEKRMAAARTVEDCQAIGKDAIYDPKGDTTAAASGESQSERLSPMIDFMREHRAGFRCCFDIWAEKIPEARLYVQATFHLNLDPKGNLQKSEVTRSDADPYVAAEVETCLNSVASVLKFPPSAKDMVTDYNHRFDFKPRRKKK